jgi:hypothetical protein
MNIREVFKKIAIETWYFLDNAKGVKFQPGEETLTDINLSKLISEKRPEIWITKFDKHEEGENGADWEWWITGKSKKWLGLRMQAKIINFETKNFKQLHYLNGKQTDKLIEHSIKDDAIPLYCLYTHGDMRDISDDFKCRTDAGIYETYGCSIIDAFRVKELNQKDESNNSIKSLFPEIIPWHCLFCSPLDDFYDIPETILSVLNHTMQIIECKQSFIDNNIIVDEYIKNYKLRDRPPAYVINFIKTQNSIGLVPDDDLTGIMIIDTKRKD